MNEQIAIALMPYIIPSVMVLIIYLFHLIFRALPAKQQEALRQLKDLASPAAQSVEQMYANAKPQEKKSLAIEAIELSLQAAGLPVPSERVISTFVEDAVFEMNKYLKPSNNNTQPLGGNN